VPCRDLAQYGVVDTPGKKALKSIQPSFPSAQLHSSWVNQRQGLKRTKVLRLLFVTFRTLLKRCFALIVSDKKNGWTHPGRSESTGGRIKTVFDQVPCRGNIPCHVQGCTSIVVVLPQKERSLITINMIEQKAYPSWTSVKMINIAQQCPSCVVSCHGIRPTG